MDSPAVRVRGVIILHPTFTLYAMRGFDVDYAGDSSLYT